MPHLDRDERWTVLDERFTELAIEALRIQIKQRVSCGGELTSAWCDSAADSASNAVLALAERVYLHGWETSSTQKGEQDTSDD